MTTKTSNGWSWIFPERERSLSTRTRFRSAFDGIYVAACPACGESCPWNAHDGGPLCECVGE